MKMKSERSDLAVTLKWEFDGPAGDTGGDLHFRIGDLGCCEISTEDGPVLQALGGYGLLLSNKQVRALIAGLTAIEKVMAAENSEGGGA